MDSNFGIIILLFVVTYILFEISRLSRQVKGLTYKLEHLSKQVDSTELPINDECRKLINEGDEVKAIRKVREALGLTQPEAKRYIHELKITSSQNK
ncbi:hypothetical protein ACFOZY_00490 [Chungangia koreensis]|uniref:Ribosomal protein L7/L12 C-terminal domain-containing protein n=1 Tax=Chungangia koreensis TaxID=752657 RepID=A0ABV8WZ31_9LACT